MTREPVALNETAVVNQALEALRTLEVRHLPVVNAVHEVVGMLSDRDLGDGPPPGPALRDLVRVRPLDGNTPVSRLMSSDPVTVDEDADIKDVIDLMLDRRIGAVPVVTPEGTLVGIVSYVDVLRALGRSLD